MTDAAFKAKNWLNRLIDLYDKTRTTETAIEIIKSRINSAVSNYENTGRGQADLIIRKAQKEDSMIEYSIKCEQYEKMYFEFMRQELITINVIEKMQNRRHASILLARHINRKSMKAILKENNFKLERTQLYKMYYEALEELAMILEREEPQAIEQADQTIKEIRQKQATA